MKKFLLGLVTALTFGSAQAALTIVSPSNVDFSGYDGEPATITGTFTSGQWGYLSASTDGIFTATYLGNESGFNNLYALQFESILLESNLIGDTISATVSSGPIQFGFLDSQGIGFVNGQEQTGVLGFAIMQGQQNQYGDFDYIIGFNDSFESDADYDDFVVGVKFVAAAVPEPETYALMMVGLTLVGFGARRRKNG